MLFIAAAVLLVLGLDAPGRAVRGRLYSAIQRFDYESAETWLERARLWPAGRMETELLAARMYRRQGRAEEMQRALDTASRLGADPQVVSLEKSLVLAQSGHLQDVEPQLMHALSHGIGDAAEISDAYSNGLTVMSQFPQAVQVLEAWRQDYSDDPRPDYRLGRIHEHRQSWDQAEEHYRRSLEILPTYYPSRYRLGRVLLYGRRVDEAREQFERCLEMPNPLAAKVQLAGCLRSLGEIDRAQKLLREVISHDYDEVLAGYAAVEETPEHYEAASMLGDIESEAGNDEQAVAVLRLALEKNPRDLAARYALAVALRQLGRTDEAELHFEKVRIARTALQRANPLRERISQFPDDLEARLELGRLLLEHESQRMGVFWLRSVLASDPENREAHELLAQHFQELSKSRSRYSGLAAYHKRRAGTP